ncbi:MAG: hypothetical protein HOI95_17730, partial [Chromatiales bacterium]|nr:hypothetical protein [Chromatiales bacterium]
MPTVPPPQPLLDMQLPAVQEQCAAGPRFDAQADHLVAQLLTMPEGDVSAREEARRAVESMGFQAARDAARRRAMLNEALSTLAIRSEDGGEV